MDEHGESITGDTGEGDCPCRIIQKANENLVHAAFTYQLIGKYPKSLRKGLINRTEALPVAFLEELFLSRDIGATISGLDKLCIAISTLHGRHKSEVFVSYGVDNLLLDILFSEISHWEDTLNPRQLLLLKQKTLNVLQELCNHVPFLKRILGLHKRDVLTYLFSMMMDLTTFAGAVNLMEVILAEMEECNLLLLDLRTIPWFTSLVNKLSGEELALFCRVLCIITMEPEDFTLDDSTWRTNQELVLSIPNILVRLVELLNFDMLFFLNREVMFVLCSLCRGYKKEQVQDRLAELGLVNILFLMFDKFDWKCPDVRRSWESFRVQYLRLIRDFLDGDASNMANKNLLKLPKEDAFENSNCLIGKIVETYLREQEESESRFWLSTCIEAFLRGASLDDFSYNQYFVAGAGIMDHVIAEILRGGLSNPSSLQANFDLLGELVKLNTCLLKKLDSILNDGDKFGRFIEVLVLNLVDSNVFLRSVLVSLESFGRHGEMTFGDYVDYNILDILNRKPCGVVAFVAHNLFSLLCDLMASVKVGDMNPDNVCVINTSLVILIFAEKNGELETCFRHFRTTRQHLTGPFRGMLEFWKTYYLEKRCRELKSLELNTNVPCSEWSRMANMLYSNPESPFSL